MHHIGEIFQRIAMLFIWLIIFGIITSELAALHGIILGVCVVGAFLFYHVKLSKPDGWTDGRVKLLYPRYGLLLVLIAICLVFGDMFWLFHIKTSSDEFPDDTLTFIVLGIVAFPLIEEFGFRLWLQGYLEKHMHSFIAILIVAAGFAMVHSSDMPIPQLLSGVLYGLALVVTGSIWVPVFLHMLHNAILIVSGHLQVVRELSFAQMDRTDDLNLYVAITLWSVSVIGMWVWWYLNTHAKNKINSDT